MNSSSMNARQPAAQQGFGNWPQQQQQQQQPLRQSLMTRYVVVFEVETSK
jgi:hypothetical protein